MFGFELVEELPRRLDLSFPRVLQSLPDSLSRLGARGDIKQPLIGFCVLHDRRRLTLHREHDLPLGARVGVSWIGGIDGTCPYCRRGLENLCDAPVFTGYTVNGGYAEYVVARSDFVFKLPQELDDLHAAPLLCAGIIGFRSLRVAGVKQGERVGLFAFGASAHLAIAVLRAWNCEVYVSTRGATHRQLAASLGAAWVGSETDKPPAELDCAV